MPGIIQSMTASRGGSADSRTLHADIPSDTSTAWYPHFPSMVRNMHRKTGLSSATSTCNPAPSGWLVPKLLPSQNLIGRICRILDAGVFVGQASWPVKPRVLNRAAR
jgi:hypothetical protein